MNKSIVSAQSHPLTDAIKAGIPAEIRKFRQFV